jgi:hypothetical protein
MTPDFRLKARKALMKEFRRLKTRLYFELAHLYALKFWLKFFGALQAVICNLKLRDIGLS